MKLLIAATFAALLLANSPAHEMYFQFLHFPLGPWPVKEWINEGLMTIFFFVIGTELREMPRRDFAKPLLGALGGMVIPALIYLAFNHDFANDSESIRGWGIPVATDIVFAVSALKVLGGGERERRFLLALAVFDDLGAVVIIALAYAGFHLSIVGFLLGLALGRPHLQRFSDLVIVPLFAFANAGLTLSHVRFDRVSIGIAVALAFGKPIGILLGARSQDYRVACLGGIGFTMSLFIAELAFPASDSPKLGIIAGSALSFVFAVVVSKMTWRSREG